MHARPVGTVPRGRIAPPRPPAGPHHYLELPRNPSLSQLINNHTLADAIDAALSKEMLASLSETLRLEQDEVYRRVVALSLDRWMLSHHVVAALNDCALLQLHAKFKEIGALPELDRYESSFQRRFNEIKAECELARDRFTEANLRLVVSIAKGTQAGALICWI